MENGIASPIREFTEKAGKCFLEYENLYNNSRLSMKDEHYNEFSRLFMDDSASDADDEITDTSHEELNSSAYIYRPRNTYYIIDGNKPLTLIIKKQQISHNDFDNISGKVKAKQPVINHERLFGIRTCDLQNILGNFENVNQALETTTLLADVQIDTEQNNGGAFMPSNVDESSENIVFPLQDFDKFYDETNKTLQKFSDPAFSGYEANCESEDEPDISYRSKYNRNEVRAPRSELIHFQNDTSFEGEHSVLQEHSIIAQTYPRMSKVEHTAQNKDKIELSDAIHYSDVNEESFSVDKEIDANPYESNSNMKSVPRNICILDEMVNTEETPDATPNHCEQLVNNLHVDQLVTGETIQDMTMDVTVGENEYFGASENNISATNSPAHREERLIEEEITNNYESAHERSNISKMLEISENGQEVHSQKGYIVQAETNANSEEIPEEASNMFQHTLFEEISNHSAYNKSVSENSCKSVKTNFYCESVEEPPFECSKDPFDRSVPEQRTVFEHQKTKENVRNKFVHCVGSLEKWPMNEHVKQNKVVAPDNTTLQEEDTKISEVSADKFPSEDVTFAAFESEVPLSNEETVDPDYERSTLREEKNRSSESFSNKCPSGSGTSVCESEIPVSNTSLICTYKDDVASLLEPSEKSNTVSALDIKVKEHVGAFPADSFADDAMDCSYNDSSSCLGHSPLLFSSDDENTYYTEESIAADTSKSCEVGNQNHQERRKLRRLQRALAGVPPPPSVTIPQLDVHEILKLFKENEKLLKLGDSTAEVGDKQDSTNVNEERRPLTSCSEEQVKNLSWPEAKSCNFYGIQYNNGNLCEELEPHYEKLRDRYVGCETLSTCNIWFPGISTKAIDKRLKRRNNGHSPGRRLSHLAKRRQTFSSANLLPSVAGSLPIAAASRGYSRLIMVEVKKENHKSKAQPVKKAALNVNNKLQQTKRALFKSPPSGRKRVSSASKRSSSSKKIKREVDRSRIHNSKRALWPSTGKSENIVPDSNSLQSLKRRREDSEEDGNIKKFPRRSLFAERDREKECNDLATKSLYTNSSNVKTLSQQHKKKLLWAVAETLRSKGVSMNHPLFRTMASSLARKVCCILPDMSQRREGRTSELMLQIAKEHVDNILKTAALPNKNGQIKT